MLDVTALGNGQYRVSDGTRHQLAYAAGPDHARWVFLDGNVYVINSGKEEAGSGKGISRTGDDATALAAPMPATVATVNVKIGQQVLQGDVLIMLEAMKMEMPIKAPRAGRVKAIACQPGDQVQPGMPLLELE